MPLRYSLFHSHASYGLTAWDSSQNILLSVYYSQKFCSAIAGLGFYDSTSAAFKVLNVWKMNFRFFLVKSNPLELFFPKKNAAPQKEWFSVYKLSKLHFLTILVRQVSHIYDVTKRSRTVNKVNLMEKGKFRCPKSLTYLALNSIKPGISPFYPLNCYIPEACKIE